MVSALSLLPVVFILAVNTVLAAVVTRLARVRMHTTWGAAVVVGFFAPVALLAVTIVVGAVAGPSLGSRGAVVGLLMVLPMALGVTIDVFWMPPPDEVDLPATLQE